jgi:hypothetical protein
VSWVAVLVAGALAAVPLGPCADAAGCSVRLPKDAAPELVDAVARLGLKAGETAAPVEPLKRAGGDQAFVLEALAQPEQRTVRVRISSLHRPAAVWGESTATVPATGDKFKARALTSAWRQAVEGAFESLTGQIAESLGQGVRRVKLAVRVNGLEKAPRAQAELVLSCLKGRLDLLGATTTPTERGGYLEETVEYAPAKDEPRQPLQYHVTWVRKAILDGPRAPCTQLGTALSKFSVQVTPDELNNGVLVAFDR